MSSVIPPQHDRLPLAYFLGQLLVIEMLAGYLAPTWVLAGYASWLAVGIGALVKCSIEPGLPMTFAGNLRRIARAHVWPIYLASA